jgi:hypothetical protein
MSSSLNLRTTRRRLIAGLMLVPLAGTLPANADPLAGLRAWGSGRFRRYGFLVYDASLWVGSEDPLQPPYALRLEYRRSIRGSALAESSVEQIQRLGLADEATLQDWGRQLQQIFPDVQDGDRIVGLHHPGGARFFFNDRPIGEIASPAFARAFFGIWLDARTTAPELRAALLRRPAG